MSKIDHTDAIENSVQANVINEVKNQMPKRIQSTISLLPPHLQPHSLKHKLYDMMQKSRSFLAYKKHLDLYNALINSMDFDEANEKGDKDTNKRRHDHQDPSADADKDTKKRKRKDYDTSSSNKVKDQAKSSKKAKALSKPSATEKAVDDEELIQEDVGDVEDSVQDDVVDVEDTTQDDATPNQDKSKWFKQDVVVRPKTLDPDWIKEPNANDAPEENWFNELVNAEKDPKELNDLMRSTINFTKFAKNCLKKDKITKADLEGPAFALLKGNFNNSIELEYNLEQLLFSSNRPDRLGES
ncbi:hypothetical protein Tco_1352907 [Tanacetum coccineum]